MKNSLFLFLLITLATPSFQQIKLKGTKISFELPNNKWKLDQELENKGLVVMIFKREPILDSSKVEVIPNIAFISEKVDEKMDLQTFASLKKKSVSFDIKKTFTSENGPLNFKNALGYIGNYSDKWGEHTIYMVYLVNNKRGVQIVCDVMTELIEEVREEFETILKSIE